MKRFKVRQVALLFALTVLLSLIPDPALAQKKCCNNPVFGVGKLSCGNAGCTDCLTKELILKDVPSDNRIIGLANVLTSASRIVFENVVQKLDISKLEEISFNAIDSMEFPESVIRIRRTNFSEFSFESLKKITVTPLLPYCKKGTILDIDYLPPELLQILQDREKEVLAPYAQLLTTIPPPTPAPCPAPPVCPTCTAVIPTGSRSPQRASSNGSVVGAAAALGQKEDSSDPKSDCSCFWTALFSACATSFFWILLFAAFLLAKKIYDQKKRKDVALDDVSSEKSKDRPHSVKAGTTSKKSSGNEAPTPVTSKDGPGTEVPTGVTSKDGAATDSKLRKEINAIVKGLEYMAYCVHQNFYNLNCYHSKFLFDLDDMKSMGVDGINRTFYEAYEKVLLAQHNLDKGQSLENLETLMAKNSLYVPQTELFRGRDDFLPAFVPADFIEYKVSKRSNVVTILELDQEMKPTLEKKAGKSRTVEGRKTAGKEDKEKKAEKKTKTAAGKTAGPVEPKKTPINKLTPPFDLLERLKAVAIYPHLTEDEPVPLQQDNSPSEPPVDPATENKLNEKRKETSDNIEKKYRKWRGEKPKPGEEAIAKAWLLLGSLNRFMYDQSDTHINIRKDYCQVSFIMCRLLLAELKEDEQLNNKAAYSNDRFTKGIVKDLHSFVDVYDILNSEDFPQPVDLELKTYLQESEYERFLALKYMGADYREWKGRLVYTQPIPKQCESVIDAVHRIKYAEEKYDVVAYLVNKFVKRRNLTVVRKKVTPAVIAVKKPYAPADTFLDREGTWRLSRGLEAPCRNGPTTNCEIKELNEAMNARNSREKEELKRKKEKDGKQAEKSNPIAEKTTPTSRIEAPKEGKTPSKASSKPSRDPQDKTENSHE